MHEPVLLNEVLAYLGPRPGEFHIDGTMDGGGHALRILKHILPSGMLLGVDWDRNILVRGSERIATELGLARTELDGKLILQHGNYAGLSQILREKGLPKADGLLIDLGFSSEQLDNSGRGFSFRTDEPLLMTYSDETEPARDAIRRMSEEELANVIHEFGGERMSRRIAKAIKTAEKPIRTTGELARIVREAVPANYERGRIDPATRTFQALRIHVNNELENLRRILETLPEIVKPGGRVAIISFHSLEDRMVKNAFRAYAKEKRGEVLTKKPIEATLMEIKRNPRSRSAKLRAMRMREEHLYTENNAGK